MRINMRMTRIIIVLTSLVVEFGLVGVAQAGSTALSNSKFTIQGDPGTVISKVLTVSNLSDQIQSYRFYPDEAGERRQRISLSPSEFQLLPRQSLDVMVRFRQGNDNWHTYLDLVASGLEQARSSFRVADGIKIPVNFIAPQVAGIMVARSSPSSWLWFWNVFIFAIDFMLLSVVCYWCYQRYFWQRIRLRHKINFL